MENPFDCQKIILSFDVLASKISTNDFLFFKILQEYQTIKHYEKNWIGTFYGKDGNIYLAELQYNEKDFQILPPLFF